MHPTNHLTELARFTGSTTFTRHHLIRRMLITEGVTYLAETAAAYWLTDAIGSYQLDKRARSEPFQVWQLTVDQQTCQGQLTMSDGNSAEPIILQQIDYTDFPLTEIELWLVAEAECCILMLPSEY